MSVELTDPPVQYTIKKQFIPWEPYSQDDPRPLARNVFHDSRSKNYAEPESDTIKTVEWIRRISTLDQLKVGSCTGNASTGVLGTDPFYDLVKALQNWTGDEAEAVAIYSLATTLDSFPGSYTAPNWSDTGSDGLSAAKACQQMGFISGYTHALSMDALLSGLQTRPCIVGTRWLTGMDTPDTSGIVKATGSIRGGHEYQCFKYDKNTGLLGFWNSWGSSYGLGGRFFMTVDDMASLLEQDGDATFFTPLDSPAPTPTPTPVISAIDQALLTAGNSWEHTIISRTSKSGKMKTAFDNWKHDHSYTS